MDHVSVGARHAFDYASWPRMTGVQRSDYLRRFAELLAQRADLLGWQWTTQVERQFPLRMACFELA
jgi:acyl-CoA reductase-like NAD-dependent aldehyde dehydrogenase